MKIGYYIREDKTREIIKSGLFPQMIDAITTFSKLKNLTPEDFLNLFAVVELKN
jgi:hypothetical protein